MREARVKVLEVKEMLAQGINPALEKKKNIPTIGGTFREIALEWLEKNTAKWRLGKSEFDLRKEKLPKRAANKRENEQGKPILVNQYEETHKLIKETYNYAAESLTKL